ncbi:alpha/beta hydrolase [Catenisphaera adipataccumulans]|uniref:Esterase n=1 Tax=Catenisphaera adipataccumulans TaxID=700500 RepID=A0A7W8CYF1_9FIRM|nr:alpha/beta hydrolase-fold protein [Catenisphaera adipataccumulans]MBB5182704.1 hypothetical protein [Catenisphaera adipataccumulans]
MSEHLLMPMGGKRVRIFPGPAGSPVVYLNDPMDRGIKIHTLLKEENCPPHTLVEISGLNWDDDMTPWYCPALTKGDTPCAGKADAYLSWMIQRLIPAVEKHLEDPNGRILTGYSLAGLFAVYALYRTDVFRCVGSMSGSLWYPDFLEYTRTHTMVRRPDCIYFSLGDKEKNSAVELLQSVQDRTEAVYEDCRGAGIPTIFELNPGNHYQFSDQRTARGIVWILRQERTEDAYESK